MNTRKFLLLVCIAILSSSAMAKPYPDKPVKMIIGFGVGSAIDNTMRLIGEQFHAKTGQPIIVEARPGAAGNIAAEHVAKSPADGYTLMSGSVGMMTINNLIYPSVGYDAKKDFDPIMLISRQNLVLAINTKIPVNSFAELVEYDKKDPGKLSYASFGLGTESHFLGVLVNKDTGTTMTHVPYKGSLPAVTDLLGGHVDLAYMPYGTVKTHVEQGKLKLLAVASDKRMDVAPNLPTFKELGYPNLEAYAWSGLVAPAGLPQGVHDYLHNLFSEILAMPSVKDKLVADGHEVKPNTTDEFKSMIEADRKRWKQAIEAANFSLKN
ncbi:Bug family tripartite tricarboxylate transporter substrate binding protein [Advenella kashmirensis]